MGVFNLIKKYSPSAILILLFHKLDPGFDPNIKNLKGKFLEKIEPFLLNNNISFISFDTTIFDINSIKTAFNQEILDLV
jgi:hypothetical protein